MNDRSRRLLLASSEITLEDIAELSEEHRYILLRVTGIFLTNMEIDIRCHIAARVESEGGAIH